SLGGGISGGGALGGGLGGSGSEWASRSLGTAVARCAGADGMALSPLLLSGCRARWRPVLRSRTRPLPLRGSAATTRGPAMQGNNGRQARQNQQAQGAPAARARRSRRRRDRGHAAHARQDPRGLRALRLRVHVACIGPHRPCIGHRTRYSLHENAFNQLGGLLVPDVRRALRDARNPPRFEASSAWIFRPSYHRQHCALRRRICASDHQFSAGCRPTVALALSLSVACKSWPATFKRRGFSDEVLTAQSELSPAGFIAP